MRSRLPQSTEGQPIRKRGNLSRRYKPLVVIPGAVLAIGLFGLACSDPHRSSNWGRANGSAAGKGTTAESIATLTLTANPSREATVQQKQLQTLAAYLQEKVGIPVQIEMAKTYEQTVDLLVEEKADLASLGVFSYLQARDRNPQLEPLVVPIAQSTGRPWHISVIVANP